MAGMMRIIGKEKEKIKYNRRGKSNHDNPHQYAGCHWEPLVEECQSSQARELRWE